MKVEQPDRERAIEMGGKALRSGLYLSRFQSQIELIADALLEFAAQEAERVRIDCTCEPYWATYNKVDPRCEAHDLADEQGRRAAELRAQKLDGK